MKPKRMTSDIRGRLATVDRSDQNIWRKWGPGFGCTVWELQDGKGVPVWFSSDPVVLMIHVPGLEYLTGPGAALMAARAA